MVTVARNGDKLLAMRLDRPASFTRSEKTDVLYTRRYSEDD